MSSSRENTISLNLLHSNDDYDNISDVSSSNSSITTQEDTEYNEWELSSKQRTTGEQIVHTLLNEVRWVTLLAQMQSGKTETYLFASCELIRKGTVEKVVIFSGNTEIDLKEQLLKEVEGKGDAKFYAKYDSYLEDFCHTINRTNKREVLAKVKKNIQVVWGSELNKYNGPTENTAFVWEEAHHAQSLKQRPDKFLKQIGISANGEKSVLEEKNNYVISVSATPFSEISDKIHLKQEKKIIYMEPGVNYNSIRKIHDSRRLKSFTTIEEGLEKALQTHHNSPKYALVRCTNKNDELVSGVIASNGWDIVRFDSISPKEIKKEGETLWKKMDQAPNRDTVILIRGRCRMGKNLEKKHLLFVMETAKFSKTDTVLQGLLGRVCGYSEGSEKVDVYIHDKIFKSDELQKYIKLTENRQDILPNRARNLANIKASVNVPIIPIKIKRTTPSNNSKDIIADLVDAFETTMSTRILNKNSEQHFNEVREKVLQGVVNKNIYVNYLDERKKTRGTNKANQIKGYYDNGEPKGCGSGSGIDAEGLKVKIWFPKRIPNFDETFYYVTAYVANKNVNLFVPTTTKREVFAHDLENNDVSDNGTFTIKLSSETAHNVATMLKEVQQFIDISNTIPNCDTKITSYFDEKNKEHKGIIVSNRVLFELETGIIQQHIKKTYGLALKVKKSTGPTPKKLKENGYTKLASISW